jgi:hypothetical protein
MLQTGTNLNIKFFIFKATQKCQNLTKLYSVETCTIHYIICQILSFLSRLEYKVFHIEICTGL